MSRKEKMKIYHGLPKSPIDEHTIFYASFDGTKNPELGGNAVKDIIPNNYIPSPTGLAYKSNLTDGTFSSLKYDINLPIQELTLDFGFMKSKTLDMNSNLILAETDKIRLWVSKTTGFINVEILNSQVYNTNYKPSSDFSDFIYVRLTTSANGTKLYINGNIVYSIPSYTTPSANWVVLYSANLFDLHISNIDRGDYFPNLPQDFIEGKAIIKERLGQQQIKGDPLISQTTELIVKSYDDYGKAPDSNGYWTCVRNPELSLTGSVWLSNSTVIVIKGLNNEIISGVIDSDTALCKIIAEPLGMSNIVTVDDVSKLKVGDSITLLYKDLAQVSMAFSITNVDTSKNQITLDYPTNWGLGCYVFETTPTTSSPIVKTVDGTVINGTWTGLGTKSASFRFGEVATELQRKDLIITYSLNMPQGNSHFPELPSDVERAYTETGIEMKPVSEIKIVDDFMSKEIGKTNNCPHKTLYKVATALQAPSQFTAECTQRAIDNLAKLDGLTCSVSAGVNLYISQQLFSFNVIEMVERKIGKIPSVDRVQWIIDNVSTLTFNWWGYGISPNGNFAEYQWWNGSSWSAYSRKHTMSSTTKGSIVFTDLGTLLKATNDGMIHFIVYSEPSDGITTSSVLTDHVNLEIKLKMDSTFTVLYCDNKRAREDKCNPVLIQKETKTVKRYIPSKECFVTESLTYGLSPILTTDTSTKNHVTESNIMFVTSEGTGGYNTDFNRSNSKNVIGRLGIPNINSSLYTPTALVSKQPWNNNTTAILPYMYVKATNSITTPFNLYNMPQEDLPNGAVLTMTKYLANVNGELYLKVLAQEHLNGVYKAFKIASYKLPNRPLIK